MFSKLMKKKSRFSFRPWSPIASSDKRARCLPWIPIGEYDRSKSQVPFIPEVSVSSRIDEKWIKPKKNDKFVKMQDLEVLLCKQDAIGAGAYGAAYIRLLKDQVVIEKELFLENDEPEEIRQKYLSQEVEALKAVQNIRAFPKFFGYAENLPGLPITSFIQEFLGNNNTMKSTSLEEICRRQCVSPSVKDVTMMKVVLDIAKGLKYMQREKWMHCDIKLDNFLWYRCIKNGRLSPPEGKIIDLGMATRITSNPEPFDELTPDKFKENQELHPIIAPEILLGKTGYTPASETYAFGVMLELIAKAFYIHQLVPLVERCKEEQPNLRPTMGQIVKCLKKIKQGLRGPRPGQI